MILQDLQLQRIERASQFRGTEIMSNSACLVRILACNLHVNKNKPDSQERRAICFWIVFEIVFVFV